jgi:hypothetical protein
MLEQQQVVREAQLGGPQYGAAAGAARAIAISNALEHCIDRAETGIKEREMQMAVQAVLVSAVAAA